MAAQESFFGGIGWTEELGQQLQEEIDKLFPKKKGDGQDHLADLAFSFTIADPNLEGCPLVGCSAGFKTLCGYEMDEIIGRNCRFLVDPVPKELINQGVRRFSREYCKAVLDGVEYRIEPQHMEPWMPPSRPHEDGLFCVQTNARKNGSLFKNMFYLKRVELNDKPYIVGLQSELEGGNVMMVDACHKACKVLDDNMSNVEQVLAARFWLSSGMRRQAFLDDGFQPVVGECATFAATSLLSEEEKKALNIDQTKSTQPSANDNRPLPNVDERQVKTAQLVDNGGCWGVCFGRGMAR